MKRCTYLLPIRRKAFSATNAQELHDYLSALPSTQCQVIVIDGSGDDVFMQHDRAWSKICRHEKVDRRFGYLNDKVNGIHTGVSLATTQKIILADDDIRYGPDEVDKICSLLDDYDVVRPQNYLAATSSLPWWAKMESARMLINRATLRTGDYPGTCAFRRSTMLRAGEYDGDVLFDNEEIVRHFARQGARICYANDFFIRKRPPKFRKWLEQRPRQAYEDFGLRAKTVLFAGLPVAILLLGIFAGLKWMSIYLFLIAIISMLLTTAGRARGTAKDFFPLHVCFFAPLWLLERMFSTYWAFYWFVRCGGYPFGGQLLTKGIGRDWVEGGKIAVTCVPQSQPRKERNRMAVPNRTSRQ